ncbi:ABC transporter substrate-binding protein [Roseiarcaceae bacterium H3SJ34-1]|uniref:ABC transporter substrate-binding protein n=1 Tax=Terripilifer ovatus TaxID=3032367 RepID=UPI003AB9AE39|nr:ABC transporter substrate-binding protein [Roseiarcaceae bacterium H3SJ34-1]
MKRLVASAAAGLGALALLCFTAQAQEKVKIGIVGHFSGPFTASGKQFREGIEAFTSLNGTKFGGREIELVYRDVGGANPAAARQAIQELIVREKVAMLGGFYLTPDALSAIPIVNETKTPMVVFNAGGRGILSQSDYVVRVGGTLYQTSSSAAEWAYKNGARRAYIAVSDYTPGHDSQEAFRERFKSLGGEVVGEDRMALNTVDYAPFVERLAGAKPDVVFAFLPNGAPAGSYLRGMTARNLMKDGMKFIGLGVPDDPDIPALGDLALGLYSSLYYTSTVDNPENKAFVAEIRKKLGADALTVFTQAQAFDGMTLIRKMLEAQAGKPLDGAASINAVKGFSWKGPQGPMTIDPATRQAIQNVYIRRAERVDNRVVNVVVDTFTGVRPQPTGN